MDDRKFQSIGEANRYRQLRLLEQAGQIENLEFQVKYQLPVAGILIAEYRADFRYNYTSGNKQQVVEDYKGAITDEFKMKYALMKAIHDIEVVLITRSGKPKALPYRYPKNA